MPSERELHTTLALLEKDHQPTMLETLGKEGYTPYQLLVATMLSARSKDSTTIPIVRKLFAQYPEPKDIFKLSQPELEQKIYGVGFYHVKAKHLLELSRIILKQYHGIVPSTMESLTSLPGIGRKTANCLLAYAFNTPAIAVDTHVHRISNRLGWVRTKTPEKTELALQKVFPKSRWADINRLLVNHGQRTCQPRRPKCGICPIRMNCQYGQKHHLES